MRTISITSTPAITNVLRSFLICILAPAGLTFAGEPSPAAAAVAPPANPLTADAASVYGGVKKILLRSAEQTPEERYSFRPTEGIRSFGEIVGHVADSQYFFCSIALGEKNPKPEVEKTRTSKAALIAALGDAFAYCDGAYERMTDANAARMVRFMGGDKTQLGVLNTNSIHTIEHYGNLVTYMRMNGIVPPTSDPAFMKTLAAKK